ncbi:ATP-binding protein [Chryseolinea lacunae]|uniref:histidine kinase n=1 Tax=Chryseolinea lacunae TaxID=2801331 RepID=A0ABS1KM50_9BACT|nr:ATP-binding protein [Chryseolinea lacunae]MBL0740521.1 response regulator [Chryseolinea lacunae]
MKRFLIAGFCVMCTAVGHAQQKDIQIDSLKRLLQQHNATDTQRVNLLTSLSRAYIGVSNNEILDYGTSALTLATSLNFEPGVIRAHNALAMAHQLSANYHNGIDHAMKALTLAEQRGDLNEKGEACRVLANIYVNLGDQKKGKHYYEQAIRAAQATRNMSLLTKVYCSVGMWHYVHQAEDSARIYLEKSLVLANKHNVRYFLPHILCQLGWINHETNPTVAIAYELRALGAAREVQNHAAELNVLGDLGNIYIQLKDYTNAEKYLTEALQVSIKNKLIVQKAHIYQGLIDLKIHQGKVDDVRHYVDAYMAARDSTMNEEKYKQIAELETRYQTEKKEQTIMLLEQEKKTEALWRKGLVMVAVLLLILGGVIFRLQRLRNRKARQLLVTQKQLNEKLQEADAIRSRFFTSISHEFRTPITLILAPLEEKLKSPTLTQHDKDDLKLVMRNANRLAELVNQVLDLSKLEAGKMEVHRQDGDLTKFLTPLLASFEAWSQSQHISFTYTLSVPDMPFAFDPDKLEKILTNLLSNAFKFTPANETIAIYITVDNALNNLLICIADTGKGISADDLPHIFTPFYQSGEMENTSMPGTGLGLALVRELVNVHGGSISVSSELEQGTSVEVVLPLVRSSADALPAVILPSSLVPEPTLSVRDSDDEPVEHFAESLLIVEDNQELRRFIGDHFKNAFNIFTATNGREALQIATARMPSLILSDVMMPEMDGVEFLKRLKQDERTHHIPVVLLTAKVGHDEKIAALQLGSDAFLAKPFSMQELEARVAGIINNRKNLATHYRKRFENAPHAAPATQLPVPSSIEARFIDNITAIIYRHLGDTAFGVEKLADEMCLSRAQLFRKVKMILDTSPSELISDLRLQHAAKLIENKSDTLSQIAYAVGFSEQSYFSKRFRKKYGVSPREYSDRMSA